MMHMPPIAVGFDETTVKKSAHKWPPASSRRKRFSCTDHSAWMADPVAKIRSEQNCFATQKNGRAQVCFGKKQWQSKPANHVTQFQRQGVQGEQPLHPSVHENDLLLHQPHPRSPSKLLSPVTSMHSSMMSLSHDPLIVRSKSPFDASNNEPCKWSNSHHVSSTLPASPSPGAHKSFSSSTDGPDAPISTYNSRSKRRSFESTHKHHHQKSHTQIRRFSYPESQPFQYPLQTPYYPVQPTLYSNPVPLQYYTYHPTSVYPPPPPPPPPHEVKHHKPVKKVETKDLPHPRRANHSYGLPEMSRRYSNGSTTSSRSTAASSTSSFQVILDAKPESPSPNASSTVTGSDSAAQTENAQTPVPEAVLSASMENEEEEENHDTTVPLSTAPSNSPTTGIATSTVFSDKAAEPAGHDPGHARDTSTTMHPSVSPNEETTAQSNPDPLPSDTENLDLPVWADPVRVRENPTRYSYVKQYMKENALPNTSSLELPFSVKFCFSDTSSTKQKPVHYSSTIQHVFDCTTVWQFSARWRLFKQLRAKPSQLLPNQNVYCFESDVEPMWEDPVNQHGGRLTLCPPKASLDSLFEWILCTFVGGNLMDHGVRGLVLSRRNRGDRIELWTDGQGAQHAMTTLKEKLYQLIPQHQHAIIETARFKKHFDK
ncbi:uncharacterized protein BYT42DRAFT_547296 [Radiomyces spectabilis]|uniref:uncharacterized protein n=1 Tax=Radiomyces spectabilis TaxID=64574 RepID=UPI00221F4133|nr:uncharacterized protein BYT42DRAFT_547296 [Radiomyces spectabilis]KAI8374219.1 hypothetical protein BYT42DRAFT_547296 [Radiomyces spectabilis]